MDKTARVLVIRSSKGAKTDFKTEESTIEKLARFGIVTLYAKTGSQESIDVVDALPDIILLDATQETAISEIAEISEKLKNNDHLRMLPICVLTNPVHFDRFPVEAHFDQRLPAHILSRKIKQLIRLAFMGIEYARRLDTARSFGLDAPDISDLHKKAPDTIRLLFLGKGERYFQLAQVFDGAAILKSCPSFLDAVQHLNETNYDCLVIDTLSHQDFSVVELETLKMNTRFFNLPVLLLQEGLKTAAQESFIEAGLCDLFDLTLDAPEIVTHIKTMVRSDYLRRALHDAFTSTKFREITDVLTGLPSGTFFQKHLARLSEQSKAWNLPIAFGVLNVTPYIKNGDTLDEEAIETITGQVGRMIASLIRTEDVANHFGEGRFVIVAPNNSANTISILLSRIAAILEMTQMLVDEKTAGVLVKTDYFISEAQNTPEQVINRLKNA